MLLVLIDVEELRVESPWMDKYQFTDSDLKALQLLYSTPNASTSPRGFGFWLIQCFCWQDGLARGGAQATHGPLQNGCP